MGYLAAGFGLFVTMGFSAALAFGTGEWRYLAISLACGLLLWGTQR